ncbi:MAG: ABC transporter substrate-binding protein [Peptoniphilus sp. oral taxon 375]|nr:ABC transporter substrate-binding protein [Peptoniphilus sp. oral taxon 375]
MKKFKLFPILLVMVLLVACQPKQATDEPQDGDKKTVTLTDVRGRQVTIPQPIKRAYYPYYYENLMAVGGEDIFEKIVATSTYDTENYSKTFWNILKEKAKGFNDIQDIGSTFQDNFDVEKLISLKPDVVILANYQYEAIGENQIQALEAVGIPVVFIDFTDLSEETHYKSLTILGQVFGQEERAQELMDNYKEKMQNLRDIVAKIPEDEVKTAYFELHFNSPTFKEYGMTYGRNGMMGYMAQAAKVENIFNDIYDKNGDANPELLFSKNPDLIFLDGGNFGGENTVFIRTGFTVDPKDTQKTLADLVQAREGWQELKAVQNKNVYAVDNDIMRTMRDYVLAEYIAKTAYPDYCKDLDPEKENREFIEKYLPILPADSCFFAQWEDLK